MSNIKSEKFRFIQATVDSLEDSILAYEQAQEARGTNYVFAGYDGLTNANCRSSILRRITLAREQLLELARIIKEE